MTCIAEKLTKKADATNTATLVGAGLGAGAGYGLGSALSLSTTGKILTALGGTAAGAAAGRAIGKDYDKYNADAAKVSPSPQGVSTEQAAEAQQRAHTAEIAKQRIDDAETRRKKIAVGLPWAEARKEELYTAGGALAGAGVGYLANRYVGRNKDAVSAIGSILAGGGLGALAGNLYYSGVLSEGDKRVLDEAAKRGISYGTPEFEQLVKEQANVIDDKDLPDLDKAIAHVKNNSTGYLAGAGVTAGGIGYASRIGKNITNLQNFRSALKALDEKAFTGYTAEQIQDMFLTYRNETANKLSWLERSGAVAKSVIPNTRLTRTVSPYGQATPEGILALNNKLVPAALATKPGFWASVLRSIRVFK